MRFKKKDEMKDWSDVACFFAERRMAHIKYSKNDTNRPTKKLPQVLIDRATHRAERRSDITTVIETLSDAHAAPPIIE